MSRQQSGPQGSEKRSAFRCRVPASRQGSVLRVGRRQIPVRVLDESAGGFAVLADRNPRVAAGEVVRLCTDSGWHEVRVVRVCTHEPAASDAHRGGENEAPQFRVGLERLRDLTPWEAERGVRAWFDRLGIGGFLPLCGSTVVVGVVLAVSVTAALAAGGVVLGLVGDSRSVSNGAYAQRAEDSSRSASRFPGQPGSSPSQRPNEPLASSSAGERSGPDTMSGSLGGQSSLAATVRLAGASPFALKEVSRELGLSESQQDEIRRIIDVSGEAVRQIRVRWPDQTRQQHAEKRQILLDEARRRVLELLTQAQRARWEALQGGTATD